MAGIGVITNPKSRANKKNPRRMRELGHMLGSEGAAEATRSLDELYRAAEEFKAANIDILGINGGDGTIHVTLTAFLKVYGDAPFPKVAILRGGTLNTIAKGIGIVGAPSDILYEIIDRARRGEEIPVQERHIMKVGADYGFIFGNGLIANFLQAYYGTGNPSPWTGAKLLARTVASAVVRGKLVKSLFRRFTGEVMVDGETWARQDYTTVTGSTVPEIGLGFKPFYRCDEKPGHFAFLGMHCPAVSLAAELPRIFMGRAMRRDKAISVVARDCHIRGDEPFGYTIDGDIYTGARELTISTGPRLRLISLPGV
jgi:diacylglycerol kinase family enzyme